MGGMILDALGSQGITPQDVIAPTDTPAIQPNDRQMIGGTPAQAVAATNRANPGYTPEDMNASKQRVANARLGS